VSEVAVQLNSMLDILAERERSLLEAQAKLDAVLDSMELALWSFTPEMDARFSSARRRRRSSVGTPRTSASSPASGSRLAQPDDRPQAEAMLERVLQAGAGVIEYRIVRPEGNLLWVEIRWRHASDAQGRRIRLDGIACDITERKLAEEENRQLLALVEQSRNEIYVFDAVTLRYEYANAGALLNLGYSFRHLRLLTPLDLMPHYTEGALTRLIGSCCSTRRRSRSSRRPTAARTAATTRSRCICRPSSGKAAGNAWSWRSTSPSGSARRRKSSS
jgi:PAS domain-containing protein